MGDPVWRFDASTCLVITAEQQATLASSTAIGALRVDIDRFAYPESECGSCVLCLDDTRYINHGGAEGANVTLCASDGNVLVASRDIARGEEILEDYAAVYGRVRLANCAAFLA